MRPKRASATRSDIARITGVPVETVRRHSREKLLDMDDFTSVARYVVAQMLLVQGKGDEE